jgi:mevalonate pyrophosphate decarboxylase
MDTIRVAIKDKQADTPGQTGMIAFNNDQVEYVKWLINDDEPLDSLKRLTSARVKIKAIDRLIETDAESISAVLLAMVGKTS